MDRKRILNLLSNLILGLVLVLAFSCVPKATEKKAVCGTNQAFNSVTRTCYSIAEGRYVPVGTLASQTLTQETGTALTLTYTDKNSNTATACSVSGVSSNFLMLSPVVTNGSLSTKANDLKTALTNLQAAYHTYYLANINATTLAADTAISTYLSNINTYYATLDQSYYGATIENASSNMVSDANSLILEAAPYIANPVINTYYTLSQTRLSDFAPYNDSLAKKCMCSGGVCTTNLIPVKNYYGTSGFSYTITDVDGESNLKSVSVTVNPYSQTATHLTPAVESVFASGAESNVSTPGTYSFTLGTARDFFGTTSFTYAHNKTVYSAIIPGYSGSSVTYVNSDSGLGKVTACLGLGGSSTSDKSCVYIPNSGDAFSASAANPEATLALADITLTAKAKGSFANNINVTYKSIADDLTAIDPYSQEASKYGMIDSSEVYIRTYGNSIYVFFNPGITTTAQIVTAINNDGLSKTLVTATGGSAAAALIATAGSAQYLAGGTNGYDTFSYTVSNGISNSTNSTTAAIDISQVTDIPEINLVVSRSSTINENTASRGNDTATTNIDLTYTYTETDGATSCTITDTSVGSYLSSSPPTCACVADVCTATVYPVANASGSAPFPFEYTICSLGGCTSTTTYNVYLTPVNDQPTIAGLSATGTVNENDTYTDAITLDPGGAGFETSQSITLTATSSNTTLIPNSAITFTGSGTSRTLNVVPTANMSGGPVTITITATDDGGTTGCTTIPGCNTQSYTTDITVNPVNNAPYFSTAPTLSESNEGGHVIIGPFTVDEDTANSGDEDQDGIEISVSSDNQSVLMDSAIRIYYDLNDNGIEDSSPVAEYRANGATLEALDADDSRDHSFYLKLTPTGGTAGSANITISVTDGTAVVAPAQTSTHIFSFVVNPVAAIHGGWDNIAATGLKTDKYGVPANRSEIACNYNTTADTNKCTISGSSSNCTGTVAPFGYATVTAENVLYWDSSNKKCYRSYDSAGTKLWTEFNTSCPITRTASICSGENCIVNGVLGVAPTATNQYYYNRAANTCHKSRQSGSTFSWDASAYYPAKVNLSWKAHTISGSGADFGAYISGYKVFRREAQTDHDYNSPIATISGSTTLEYTDTTAEAGRVYYYVVRPVDNKHSFATYTPEVFSEVRVIAPPRNYAFVHRWMVNQEICNKMHMTTSTTNKVDPSHNFRCPYYGPGTNAGYYDYGSDLLVDLVEVGCPYTITSTGTNCTNGSNGCIGIGKPDPYLVGAVSTAGDVTTLSNETINDIYYDRNAGGCYIFNGTDWVDFNNSTSLSVALITSQIAGGFDKYNSSLNPPMTNINQSQATTVCANRTPPTIYKNPTTTVVFGAAKLSLPEKKDYMAYSAAPLKYSGSAITDTIISDIEQGDSLDVQSRCNGSGASGLTSYYTDSTLPSSSYIYTVTGTASSAIKSLYTGSIPWGYNKGTETCSSRYGVQDIYGNVAEWVKDQMSCSGTPNFVCSAVAGTNLYYDFYDDGGAAASYNHLYSFDLLTGPYNDANGSGLASDTYSSLKDAFLTEWDLADETFEAGKFSLPLGLPMYTNYANLVACNYTKQAAANCSVDGTNGCIGSGDPSSLTFSTAPADTNRYLDHSSGKCYEWDTPVAPTAWAEITPTPSVYAGLNFILDIGSSSGITYSQLHGDGAIINATSGTSGFAVGGSYLSGARSGRYTSELIPATDTGADVGMRCILPMTNSYYDNTDPFHTYSY